VRVAVPGPHEPHAGSLVAQVINLHRSGLAEPYRKQVPEPVELIPSSSAKVLSG